MTPASLAHNLLRHRLQQGLTQEQLAERAGVTARTIQRLEAARSAAHPSTLALLAGALSVPVQALELAPPPSPEPGPAPRPAAADRRALALLHLLPLLGAVVPLANVLAPLGYWLSRPRDEPAFVAQTRLVINFHVSVTLGLGLAVALLLSYFWVGLGLLALCWGAVLGLSGVNARRAWRGVPVHYPWALPVLGGRPQAELPA